MPKDTFFNLADGKRTRLIDAAVREFSEQGYVAGSLDRIALAASVSKGSLYQYFENKLDLYQWLLREELPRKKREVMASATGHGLDIFETLEVTFLAGLEFFIEEPDWARLGATLMGAEPIPELRTLHQQSASAVHTGLRAMVKDAQTRDEISPVLDVDLTATIISQFMGTGLVDTLLRKNGQDRNQLQGYGLALERVSKQEIAALVKQASSMLRRALGP